MSITKIRSTTLIDITHYKALIYGPTGIGKSTWVSQIPDIYFLDFEGGLGGLSVFRSRITDWAAFIAPGGDLEELCGRRHPYKNIAIDTMDWAYNYAAEYVCANAAGKKVAKYLCDVAHGNGWFMANQQIRNMLMKLNQAGLGIYIVNHSKSVTVESRTEETYTKKQPDMSDGLRRVVLGGMDAIFYRALMYVPKVKKTVHAIATKPHKLYEAKDRYGAFDEFISPDYQTFITAIANHNKNQEKK